MAMLYDTPEKKAWALQNDTEYFSRELLNLTAKEGGIVPFAYTPIQKKLNNFVQYQLLTEGEVDVTVVKPRQMRATTYFNSWEWQQLYWRKGLKIQIISHLGSVTNEIFDTIKHFNLLMPSQMRMEEDKNNRLELSFEATLNKLRVATAGTNASRGFAAQITH